MPLYYPCPALRLQSLLKSRHISPFPQTKGISRHESDSFNRMYCPCPCVLPASRKAQRSNGKHTVPLSSPPAPSSACATPQASTPSPPVPHRKSLSPHRPFQHCGPCPNLAIWFCEMVPLTKFGLSLRGSGSRCPSDRQCMPQFAREGPLCLVTRGRFHDRKAHLARTESRLEHGFIVEVEVYIPQLGSQPSLLGSGIPGERTNRMNTCPCSSLNL